MKSQRRHELQTNYLADHLGTAVQTGRPYAMWVMIAVAAAIVLAIGYGIYTSQAHKANAQAWGDYYFNIGTGDAEVFRQVAEEHPRTAAADWAMQAWADNQLMVGLDQIYTNRKDAEEAIQQAINAYNDIHTSADDQELKNRAAIGLAQAYESLGKLDEATGYYQQVATGGSGAFANMATERLAWIKSGEGKAFYDWFASVRSTPAPPPALPSDLSRPPTAPDFGFPQKQNPLTLPGAATSPAPTSGTTTEEATPGSLSSPPSDLPPAPAPPSQPAAPSEQPGSEGEQAPSEAPASPELQIEPSAPATEAPAPRAEPESNEGQPGDQQPPAPNN